MYVVPAVSPVSEYVVAELPVLETRLDQVEPPLADLSIMYPVMEEPPLLEGAVQERLICKDKDGFAERFVGGCAGVLHILMTGLPDNVPLLLIVPSHRSVVVPEF